MDLMISDITVVLDVRYAADDKTQEAVQALKTAGMEVRDIDNDISVITGTCEAGRERELEKLDCVDYVRTSFTYCAEFPPGDPRDRNGE